jgi:hypothetical protein
MSKKAINNLFWHDGNLIDVSYAIDSKGKSSVTITALFYKNEQAPTRDKLQIQCGGVSRFSSSLDATELKKNMFAGNIWTGHLRDDILRLYFTEGFLEVQAKRFRLVGF